MLEDSSWTKIDSIDLLYLDNTYCDPSCVFPTREQCKTEIIRIIEQHQGQRVHIGVRNLGKEVLLADIAKHFGTWIVVDEAKYQTLQCIEASNVFSTNPADGFIRLVNLMKVGKEMMKTWNRETPTIAILPTAVYSGLGGDPFQSQSNVFVISYSDHSSFPELMEFVSHVKPKCIMPIVSGKARGVFSTDLSSRADMTCFSQYMSLEPWKPFQVPESVKQCMRGASSMPRSYMKQYRRYRKERDKQTSFSTAARGVSFDEITETVNHPPPKCNGVTKTYKLDQSQEEHDVSECHGEEAIEYPNPLPKVQTQSGWVSVEFDARKPEKKRKRSLDLVLSPPSKHATCLFWRDNDEGSKKYVLHSESSESPNHSRNHGASCIPVKPIESQSKVPGGQITVSSWVLKNQDTMKSVRTMHCEDTKSIQSEGSPVSRGETRTNNVEDSEGESESDLSAILEPYECFSSSANASSTVDAARTTVALELDPGIIVKVDERSRLCGSLNPVQPDVETELSHALIDQDSMNEYSFDCQRHDEMSYMLNLTSQSHSQQPPTTATEGIVQGLGSGPAKERVPDLNIKETKNHSDSRDFNSESIAEVSDTLDHEAKLSRDLVNHDLMNEYSSDLEGHDEMSHMLNLIPRSYNQCPSTNVTAGTGRGLGLGPTGERLSGLNIKETKNHSVSCDFDSESSTEMSDEHELSSSDESTSITTEVNAPLFVHMPMPDVIAARVFSQVCKEDKLKFVIPLESSGADNQFNLGQLSVTRSKE